MTLDYRTTERRRFATDLQAREKEIASVLKVSSPSSPKAHQQMNDKRVRREIANGNERRRMQCINAGFTSLRALIPHLEGEKLSKAAILQQSIDYISSLEKEKTRMQMQLEQTTRLLTELGQQDRVMVDPYCPSTPPPSKRKKRDTESSDEGVGSLSDASDDNSTDLRQKNEALKHQMEREQNRAESLEEENKSLRNLIYLIQKQSAKEQQPITLVTTASHQEARLREVVESMSPQLNYTPPHHQDEMMEYSMPAHPVSPDHTIAMVTSTAPQMNNRILEPVTVVELRDAPSTGFLNTPSPSHLAMSSPGSADMNITTSAPTPAPETTQSSSDSSFLHNYAHRDHPRRRRHQAQLERERIEEEERQQIEREELQLRLQQQQQQQHSLPVSTTTNTYIPRPQHSVRSLDILAEAANHVKDERTAQMFEEEKPAHMNHPPMFQSSDDMSNRLTNQMELSDRISPLHNTATIHPMLSHPFIHQSNSPNVPIIVSTASTENTSSPNSNSFSEKYPIASHLLHRPLHSPFTRPGVIVQKH